MTPAAWVNDMIASGNTSFYTVKEGATHFYSIASKSQTKSSWTRCIHHLKQHPRKQKSLG